jgi:hypothetical protein
MDGFWGDRDPSIAESDSLGPRVVREMSLRTVEQLVDAVSSEISWRRKELTDLKCLLEAAASNRTRQSTLTRAALALLYAHWEGYVKSVAEMYLEFVCMQRCRNLELSDSLLAVTLRSMLASSEGSHKIKSHVDIVQFFRTQMETRSRLPYKSVIRTEFNLSSTVFFEILRTLGFTASECESKSHMLDHQLLAKRNHVAHGNNLPIDIDEYFHLHDEILALMNLLRNYIENAAETGAYLRAPKALRN